MKLLRIFAAGLIAATPAAAADNIDEIIVDGLRLPTPLTETGTSVSVITADDIELRGYSFALDALATAPGVTVNQNGAFGGVATLSIRGASSDQTLVLLDGAPIGDPSAVGGGYDFSILDVAEIERVEILKGPQSVLWGSDAIGGVVNIVTKTPNEGLGLSAFAEAGSFKTYRGGASMNGRNDTGEFRIAVSAIDSDGISKADAADGNDEADAYDGLTLSGRGALNLPHHMRLETTARYMKGETEIDGFPPPVFALTDTRDFSDTEQLSATAQLSSVSLNNAFKNSLFAGYTDIERRGDYGGFATRDKGDRLVLRYLGTIEFFDAHRLAFGAEREEADANNQSTSINGFFGLYEFKPVADFTITAGVRHDDHSDFGGETTARIAAKLNVNEYLALRSSWGEGFKAPTIFQLTQTFGALPANGNLMPETSSAFDIGIDATLDNGLRFSATYFNRDTENLIIFAPNFRYENLNRTEAQGMEVEISAPLTQRISLAANYAYIDAQDADTGEQQIRIPRHTADVAFIYGHQNLSGAVSVRYNGDEREGFFGADVDDWVRVDLSAQYAISEAVQLYGRIENLFDEHYQQISGYGTPGLSASGGVRLKL